MTDAEFDLVLRQRNSMAIYLKITRACACCFYRDTGEKCPDCKVGQSKWEWGGWKGKSTPEGNEVYASADKYFFNSLDKQINLFELGETE